MRRKAITAVGEDVGNTSQSRITLPKTYYDDADDKRKVNNKQKSLMRAVMIRFCLVVILINLLVFMWAILSIIPGFSNYINSSSSSASSVDNEINNNDNNVNSNHDSTKDKEKVRNLFLEAGITLGSDEILDQLPSWNQIEQEFGPGPKIYGLDKCPKYRAAIPAVERNIGCCGMFNSGTNLVTKLLKFNCKIPERITKYGWNNTMAKWGMGEGEAHGIRWQVPWGKHTHARYRDQHATKQATDIDKDSLLPVVTIRHPYGWMKSMCKNSYTAHWRHNATQCPHLVRNKDMDPVKLEVSYGGEQFLEHYDSLAHLWNGWYEGYWRDAEYPFLMVRFEDLIFHTKSVITQICHCAGGQLRQDRPFQYMVESAKEGPGHGKESERTGMEKAWMSYGRQPTSEDFTRLDQLASVEFLNPDLMELFGYRHDPLK